MEAFGMRFTSFSEMNSNATIQALAAKSNVKIRVETSLGSSAVFQVCGIEENWTMDAPSNPTYIFTYVC